MSSTTVGIDFGTSTTLVAESLRGRPAVIPIGEVHRWMPSVASVSDGTLIVAEQALKAVHPGLLINSVKRCITSNATTVASADGSITRDADEVIHAVLVELVKRARLENLDIGAAGQVRLGCPAMWDSTQRTRLLTLAQGAGIAIDAATMIDEPIAAGIAWIQERVAQGEYLDEARLLVFDMGGGTLDVALLDITAGPGQTPEICVLSASGLNEAGDVLDKAIADDLVDALHENGINVQDLDQPELAMAYIRRAATSAKQDLTHVNSTVVQFDFPGAPLPDLKYTREQLGEAIRPQLDRARRLLAGAVRAAFLTEEDLTVTSRLRQSMSDAEAFSSVTHVLLAGGMSQAPAVGHYLSKLFTRAVIQHTRETSPHESVVAGLAESSSYDRINMHRPGFDFVLTWSDFRGEHCQTLYTAHTPLYEPWEALSKNLLAYAWPDREADRRILMQGLPRSGNGAVHAVALDGSHVDMRLAGTQMSELKVQFGGLGFRFSLTPHGTMSISDAHGAHVFRVERWPVLSSGRTGNRVALQLETWTPTPNRPGLAK